MLINNGRKNRNPRTNRCAERRQDAQDLVRGSSRVKPERGDTNAPPKDWTFRGMGGQTNGGGGGQTRAKLSIGPHAGGRWPCYWEWTKDTVLIKREELPLDWIIREQVARRPGLDHLGLITSTRGSTTLRTGASGGRSRAAPDWIIRV